MAAAGTHPHIVRYHCAWMEDAAQPGEHHVYILMEACADSLVGQRVVSQAPMREPELLDLLRQARSCQPICPHRAQHTLCTQNACSCRLAGRIVLVWTPHAHEAELLRATLGMAS